MKVLFIQKDIFAKPGIMLLSAVLKKAGHACDVLIDDLETNLMAAIDHIQHDLTAFSITTNEYNWFLHTAGSIKKKTGSFIICGGPHPTFNTELIWEDCVDAICIGEGEGALSDLVNQMQKNKKITAIPNLYIKLADRIYKNKLRPRLNGLELDQLPHPDRQLYLKYPVFRMPHNDMLYHHVIFTARGCPYVCTFCFNKRYNRIYQNNGSVFRRRSVADVINELIELKTRHALKFIIFEDDAFSMPPFQWLREFLQAYKRHIRLPFKIATRVDLLDEEVIALLAAAKCYSIRIGIESGNENIRNRILCKQLTHSQIIRVVKIIKKYRIRIQTLNIVGNPGETLEAAMETYKLNRLLNPDFAWCSLLHPYPGTEIFDYACQHHYLEDKPDWDYYFKASPVKTNREIINLQKLFSLGIFLHLPINLMQILIKQPFKQVYQFIFGVSLFIGLLRINHTSVRTWFKVSVFYLFRYNFY